MFYNHFKISNDNCTTLHLTFCWHSTRPSPTPPTAPQPAHREPKSFASHSSKFVSQCNVNINEPCRDGQGFGTPKNKLWKSGSVKICSKIKPDYLSLKLIQNTRLGEIKLTTTGSYFVAFNEDTVAHTSFFFS